MKKTSIDDKGQALVEYLLVLIIVAGIGTLMVKGMVGYFGTTLTSFSYILTKELSVGVCQNDCLTNSYINKTE